MSAYVIFNVTVTDPVRYADYARHTPRIIAEHGGRMLVRGGAPEVLEGNVPVQRIVVLEFKDRKAAQAFFNSPAYQAIIGIRQEASVAQGVLVDGFPSEAWAAAVTESKMHS